MHKKTIAITAFALAVASAASPPGPAEAASRNRESCSEVKKLPDGRFTYQLKPGLSVLEAARRPGPFAYEHPGDVTGFSCLRARPLPELDDVEILQAGFELYLGGGTTDLTMIKLSLVNGQVRHQVIAGSLSARGQKELTGMVAGMQARMAAPPR